MHSLLLRIFQYFRYRYQARNIQYIHSPFLFQLMRVCFYDQPEDIFRPIEKLRRKLLQDKQEIIRTDWGAGNTRKAKVQMVKSIARRSLQPARNARFLFRLTNHVQAKNILELGTSFGITTAYLSQAAKKGNIITIEGDPAIWSIATKNFHTLGLTNIRSVCGAFDDVLAQILSTCKPLDLVWIDGNHRKDPTLRYFKILLPFMHPEGMMIFDDIHWSKEMAEAWALIRADEKATLTVDIFQMGLVFFSEKLSKEHRVIKYPL